LELCFKSALLPDRPATDRQEHLFKESIKSPVLVAGFRTLQAMKDGYLFCQNPMMPAAFLSRIDP
jgi:hypothetical protein